MKIWSCKIGEADEGKVPVGADWPMRVAVARAYQELTGEEPRFVFSGWAASLTESERAVVEDRPPQSEKQASHTQDQREGERLKAVVACLGRFLEAGVKKMGAAWLPGPLSNDYEALVDAWLALPIELRDALTRAEEK